MYFMKLFRGISFENEEDVQTNAFHVVLMRLMLGKTAAEMTHAAKEDAFHDQKASFMLVSAKLQPLK